MSIPTLQSSPKRWMDLGFASHNQGVELFLSSKQRIFTAGKCFLSARRDFEGEGWEDFVKAYIASVTPKGSDPVLSLRTVQAYIKFYSDMTDWAKEAYPTATAKELEEYAIKLAIDTPGSYMSVLRAVRLLRDPFGYDPEKYQQDKTKKTLTQVEFNFEKVFATLDFVEKLGSAEIIFKLPENKSKKEAVSEILNKLDKVREHLLSQLADTEALPVDTRTLEQLGDDARERIEQRKRKETVNQLLQKEAQ
ncbi:MAG: hypothetical protein ACK4UN_15530 [Limisphaerales bacterium]